MDEVCQIVIVCDITGARGTDFAMSKAAHVILGFVPEDKTMHDQALGRGSRKAAIPCDGTLVCHKDACSGLNAFN